MSDTQEGWLLKWAIRRRVLSSVRSLLVLIAVTSVGLSVHPFQQAYERRQWLQSYQRAGAVLQKVGASSHSNEGGVVSARQRLSMKDPLGHRAFITNNFLRLLAELHHRFDASRSVTTG